MSSKVYGVHRWGMMGSFKRVPIEKDPPHTHTHTHVAANFVSLAIQLRSICIFVEFGNNTMNARLDIINIYIYNYIYILHYFLCFQKWRG